MDLELYHSFGVNCDVVHNVTFYSENTLVFIAGKLAILLDLTTRQQNTIQIAEGQEITVISRCADQLALAMKGRPPSICLLNIASETKRMYHSPVKMKSDQYLCISVSASLKFVAAQGSSPDWKLVFWLATTRDIVAVFNPTSKRPFTAVREISFHAGGREEVVAVGRNVFRLYEYQEAAEDTDITFREIIFDKFEAGEEYCAIAWPQKETLAVSKLNGKVLFFRGIEFVHEVDVSRDVKEAMKEKFGSSGSDFTSVTCLACTAKEIFCTFGGNVVAGYKGEEVSQYTLDRLLMLPTQRHSRLLPGEIEIHDDIITHMELSPRNELVVVSTTNGQLFYSYLGDAGEFKEYFQSLLSRQHAGPILSMDIARGRPLIATASKHCAILWNYKTKEQELIVTFKDTVSCLAIHPSGLYLALGFVFYTRMCTILYNGLKDRQLLEPKNCTMIRFSYGGHLLALASEAVIDVFDFMTSKKLARLASHAGRVSSMAWKEDDTRIVSCDLLGVICEWDVATWTKMWENVDTASFSYIAVTPNKNRIIVVTSVKGLKCLEDGLVEWEFNCPDELISIVACADDETFYVGRKDGSLALYKIPTGLSNWIHAHNGEVTYMMFCLDYRILFTVSAGGLLFGWKHGKIIEDALESSLSNVVFASTADLKKQKEKEELLRMSIQHCNMAFEYDTKLNELKHEETKRKNLVDNESTVKYLNNEIAQMKEKVQDLTFETSPSIDLRNIEDIHRKKLLEQTEKLAEVYKQTGRFVEETREIIRIYEDTLKSTEKDYAETCADVKEREKEALAKVKDLELLFAKEKIVNEGRRNSFEDEKKRAQDDEAAKAKILMETERLKLEGEKCKTKELEEECKRLRLLKLFVQKDNQRKQNIAYAQIDLDISEKSHSIRVLEQKLRSLEYKLQAKDKIARQQDSKFFETRKLVGDLQRADFISKEETEILKSSIKSTEKEIDLCQAEIKAITQSVPSLEEQIRLVKNQCSTLDRKLKETIDGFGDKRKLLRHNQKVMDKYKSLLYQSRSQTCDAGELRKEILQLFSQIKKGTDETLDPNLKKEFAHQFQTLQDVYKDIRGDPARTTKDLSLVEFKMSQENAELLRDVHEVRKEHGQLRDVIFEMEVGMGMPYTKQAKMTKEVEDLRDKIELVVRSFSRSIETDKRREIERLDKLIGEQQDEVQRLQSMLSEKAGKK